jgi:hypothetical protein
VSVLKPLLVRSIPSHAIAFLASAHEIGFDARTTFLPEDQMIHRKRNVVVSTITTTVSVTLKDLPTHHGFDLPLTLTKDGLSKSTVRRPLKDLRLHDISLTDELLPFLGSHVQPIKDTLRIMVTREEAEKGLSFTFIDCSYELNGIADLEKVQILEFHERTYARTFGI